MNSALRSASLAAAVAAAVATLSALALPTRGWAEAETAPLPAKATVKGVNPSDAEVAAALESAAKAHRIPTVLLKALAWQASGWKQFDDKGQTIAARPNHEGILGVWTGKRDKVDPVDAERARTDWRYNIEQGAKQLELCWYRAPIIGDGQLEDGRDILESWYFALGRYWDGTAQPQANHSADAVLDALGTDGQGRFPAITVTRPTAADLSWGRNVIGAPVPWHFGDVAPRPAPVPVVALNIPYANQAWDSPDGFDGSGSCGPTSMVMVLAFYKQFQPKPLLVHGYYDHKTILGTYIPQVHDQVCDPGMGAVHYKMLRYFKPTFPNVAIFYNKKATFERVKAELDAGRPCILGTTVTPAGHLMVARGYTTDGRILINDPAGNYYEASRRGGPMGGYSPTGGRYWNGDGDKACYDWFALGVDWVMTFPPTPAKDADNPNDL